MSPRPRARRVSKAERWLNLLAFLLDRRYPVSREQILSEVEDYRDDWLTRDRKTQESVRRKFERDKRELRELGIVIEPRAQKIQAEHTAGEVEAYLLQPRDFYLPYLEVAVGPRSQPRPYSLPSLPVTLEELAMLRRAAERVLSLGETPLGPSAASALRKLSFDLPAMTGAERESLAAPVDETFRKVFAVLRYGIERRRRIACRYYSIGRDTEEDRDLEPYALMLIWGHWYCVGRSRDAIRVFRLSRMRRAEAYIGGDGGYEIPRDFSVRDYLDRAPWELSESPPVSVRIRLAFPHSRWVMAEGLGRVIEALDGAGGAVLEFQVRSVDPFLRWLLPFGTQVEVLSPGSLAALLETERHRVRALYS